MAFMTTSQLSSLQYFASVRPANSYDAGDGAALGQLLFIKLRKHRKNEDLLTEKILDMIRTMDVLRSAQAKYRYLGAGVSAADALSDAYMINVFYVTGNVRAAKGLLAMVGANVAWQTLLVYMQTQGLKKNKWRTAFFEMLTVVFFVKPGIDAHRVASGEEQIPGAAMTPLTEMIYTKAGELMFEAIPGLVLQLVALLNAETSKVAIVSILVSTASTALTATTMFWDVDTDPASRKRSPEW
ncbi:hypothetical protein TeGR_g8117 [Tetraparma gracilis]|uniref:Uncharacterized protein n=1 Tax=Tetraparma gracilis TaxID=2962635 RepID=A0ABQ6MGW3_9STRA|nr:hypothetical protein TeGR_g8117 [Tetraparma gracilis]